MKPQNRANSAGNSWIKLNGLAYNKECLAITVPRRTLSDISRIELMGEDKKKSCPIPLLALGWSGQGCQPVKVAFAGPQKGGFFVEG